MRRDVRAATNNLKASSLPGATLLSGCNRTANLRYALLISSLKNTTIYLVRQRIKNSLHKSSVDWNLVKKKKRKILLLAHYSLFQFNSTHCLGCYKICQAYAIPWLDGLTFKNVWLAKKISELFFLSLQKWRAKMF